MTWCPPVIATMAALCLRHRETFGGEKPRELRLAPLTYREWREAAAELVEHADADDFFGVPVRCSARLGNGIAMASTR
jgi:hypothetical protein